MATLEIVIYPDPRLREKCSPVAEVTDEIRSLLNDMVETMYDAPGIGLAACQVGITKRLVVIDIGEDFETGAPGQLYKLVNPEIISSDGRVEGEEGCLSIPDIREYVTRAEKVVVKALNEQGTKIEICAAGLLAICLQHEIDHLNGVLFIDHLSRLKREMVKGKLRKLTKENSSAI